MRLEELGARRFQERADCDLEFHQAASNWVSEVLRKCKVTEMKTAPIQISTENLHQFHPATVKEKVRLNEGSSSETYHVVLAIGTDFRYQSGDSVGIVPQNQEKLLNDEKKLPDYLHHHDLLDVITDFPFSLNPEDFVSILRKLQPRYYSISSSLRKHPGEVHLSVKLVRSKQNSRVRSGACSSYLNHWTEVSQKINLQLIPNKQFRIQTGGTPMIMIAAGTGIAPFRAFLEEQEIANFPGKSWLFFGEKYQKYDFFYREDWEHWLETKRLERIDVAFSRDQTEKVYVQHKIMEQANEFYEWLNQGAHIYVCGSVTMGNDVRQAICRVIQTVGEKTEPEALLYWEKMIDGNRIHQDVY